MDEGELEQAFIELEKLEEWEDLTSNDKLSCDILKTCLMFDIGVYNDAIKLAEQIILECQESNDLFHLIDIYIIKASIIWGFGEIYKAIELITKSEELIKTYYRDSPIELKKKKALLAFLKGYAYWDIGKVSIAFENIKLCLALREEIGKKQEIALSLGQMGDYYDDYKGDWNQALLYHKKAYELAKKAKFKYLISLSLNRFGFLCELKGKLNRALEYYKRSLKLSSEMGHKLLITLALTNIGRIYQGQGQLDRALEHYEKCLKIKKETGYILDSYMQPILDALFYLSYIKKDLERANYYFEQIKKFKNQEKALFVEKFFRLDEALLMKMSPLPHKRLKAKMILKDIIKTRVEIKGTLRALINLCDLLLNELQETNDLKLLDEIRMYLNQINTIAKKQESYSLLSENYLLKAKIELLTLNLKGAQRFLNKAQDVAEKYGLIELIERILEEQNEFLNEKSKMESLKRSKTTIAEIINLAHIDDQFTRMIRKRYFS